MIEGDIWWCIIMMSDDIGLEGMSENEGGSSDEKLKVTFANFVKFKSTKMIFIFIRL